MRAESRRLSTYLARSRDGCRVPVTTFTMRLGSAVDPVEINRIQMIGHSPREPFQISFPRKTWF